MHCFLTIVRCVPECYADCYMYFLFCMQRHRTMTLVCIYGNCHIRQKAIFRKMPQSTLDTVQSSWLQITSCHWQTFQHPLYAMVFVRNYCHLFRMLNWHNKLTFSEWPYLYFQGSLLKGTVDRVMQKEKSNVQKGRSMHYYTGGIEELI